MKFASRNLMAVNCPLLRIKVVDIVGAWNEELRGAEDWEYWIRCSAAHVEFHFEDRPGTLALVRLHAASATQEEEEDGYEHVPYARNRGEASR